MCLGIKANEMPLQKSVNITVSSKVLAATALGTGVLLGAGVAYLLTRIHEHSNLSNLVSHLHSTINEVKQDLANIENELSNLQGPAPFSEEKVFKRRHKKAVSFSSTSSSYRTADEPTYVASNETFSDTASWRTAPSYDTDYFSPDEDEEFFDISPADEECELASNNTRLFDGSRRISDDASNLSNLLRAVDNLIERSEDQQIEAYNLLMDNGSKYENNAEILWRKAKAARNLAIIEGKQGNIEKQKEYFNEGYEYALNALKINDSSAEVHKWFAILSGSRGEFLSTKERILSGQDFKKHIDIALQISPNDAILHHLLGRYCYELSLLTWLERKVAATLFEEVPISSFKEALDHFLAAEEMRTDAWKENKLFIGHCYLKMGMTSEAEICLRKALEISSMNANDEVIDQEIEKLSIQHSFLL